MVPPSHPVRGTGMDWDDTFPFLLFVLLAAAIMAAKWRRDMQAMQVQLAGLAQTVRTLDRRVSLLTEQLAAPPGDEPPVEDSAPVMPAQAAEPTTSPEEPPPIEEPSADACSGRCARRGAGPGGGQLGADPRRELASLAG